MRVWQALLHMVTRVARRVRSSRGADPGRRRVGDEPAASRAGVRGPVVEGPGSGDRTRRRPGRDVLVLGSLAAAFLFIVNKAKQKGGAVPPTPEGGGPDTLGQADLAISSDDDARLSEILATVGTPAQLGALLSDYYRDKARADRTSRELLYLHLGLAIGALRNVTGARG